MSRALTAWEPCGCNSAIYVLPSTVAYEWMAKEAKRGCTIEEVDVEEWRTRQHICDAHKPDGPPWWSGNTPSAKRLREKERARRAVQQQEMGL